MGYEITGAIILILYSWKEKALFAGMTFDILYSTDETTGRRNKEKRQVIREMEGEIHNPSLQQLIQIASSTIKQNETTRDSNAKGQHKRKVYVARKSPLNSESIRLHNKY